MIKNQYKTQLIQLALGTIIIITALALLPVGSGAAQSSVGGERAAQACQNSGGTWNGQTGTCGTGGTSVQLDDPKDEANDCNDVNLDESNCGIIKYLVIIINFLSAMVGIVVVGSIIFGGILYSSSGGDPSKVSAAKDRIRNSIIALLVFIFTYSLLNWLVPGGVL